MAPDRFIKLYAQLDIDRIIALVIPSENRSILSVTSHIEILYLFVTY